MDKELFKDKNPLLRRQMLEDNCAAVERITYTSPFSEEEMGERKTELANIDLDIRTNGSRNENPDCNSSRFESGLIHINQSL